MVRKEDPIYALATPEGVSAISVIRISGLSISKKFFNFLGIKNKKPGVFLRSLSLGGFTEKCLVLYFKAPQSYTGEDVIEIQPHGSMVVVSEILDVLEGFGFREAQAGEFTKRGFMNNKFTIDEAESVAANIEASSAEELRMLEDFRLGRVGNFFSGVTKKIENLLVTIESQLDFSDEEAVAETKSDVIQKSLNAVLVELDGLLKNYAPYEKNSLKKRVVLVGRPNVGKSSIFNALLDEEVAIVSSVAGTTRDVVRKVLPLSGFEVEIEDTAGLRSETNDEIEKTGMGLTIKAAASADLLIYVIDNAKEVIPEKFKDHSLVVFNKCDLSSPPPSFSGLKVSAKSGEGIDLLLEKMRNLATSSSGQKLVSERTHKKLEDAMKIISKKVVGADFFELTAQNIRDANQELKEIYADLDNEKILDQIFNNFCIGK